MGWEGEWWVGGGDGVKHIGHREEIEGSCLRFCWVGMAMMGVILNTGRISRAHKHIESHRIT